MDISHRWVRAEFWLGARFIKVSTPKIHYAGKYGGGRGGCSEFSRKSRSRLLQKLSKTKTDLLPVFITLTYPAEYPDNSHDWKTHLDRFAKRMIRRFPHSGFVWKLEPQKRSSSLSSYGVGHRLSKFIVLGAFCMV